MTACALRLLGRRISRHAMTRLPLHSAPPTIRSEVFQAEASTNSVALGSLGMSRYRTAECFRPQGIRASASGIRGQRTVFTTQLLRKRLIVRSSTLPAPPQALGF